MHACRALPLIRRVSKATSVAVSSVYTTLGRRSAAMDQWRPQSPATMACQNSMGGLVLRMLSSSLARGNQWPVCAVARAMCT